VKTQKGISENSYESCDGRVAFSINDGTHYEGYMFEILNDNFTFLLGGPLAPDEPVEIKISDVDLNSLCYYDDSEHFHSLYYSYNPHGQKSNINLTAMSIQSEEWSF